MVQTQVLEHHGAIGAKTSGQFLIQFGIFDLIEIQCFGIKIALEQGDPGQNILVGPVGRYECPAKLLPDSRELEWQLGGVIPDFLDAPVEAGHIAVDDILNIGGQSAETRCHLCIRVADGSNKDVGFELAGAEYFGEGSPCIAPVLFGLPQTVRGHGISHGLEYIEEAFLGVTTDEPDTFVVPGGGQRQ